MSWREVAAATRTLEDFHTLAVQALVTNVIIVQYDEEFLDKCLRIVLLVNIEGTVSNFLNRSKRFRCLCNLP